MKSILATLAIIPLLFCPSIARAQSEPDLTLSTVEKIASVGPNLIGDLSDGAQDLWSFTVTEDESPRLYSATLSGVVDTGGALGLMKIERNDAGEVTRRTDIQIAGIRPLSQNTTVTVGPRMLAAGEYLLGVTPLVGGIGNYEVQFRNEFPVEYLDDFSQGLWTGTAQKESTCLDLPTGHFDVEIFSNPDLNVSAAIVDAEKRENIRGYVASLFSVSNLNSAGHSLCLKASETPYWIIRITNNTTMNETDEAEPNDVQSDEITVQPNSVVMGRIDHRGDKLDNDRYLLDHRNSPYELSIEAEHSTKISYTLTTLDGDRLKYGDGAGFIEIWPLAHSQDLILTLTAKTDTAYTLSHRQYPTLEIGEDAEPNDRLSEATEVPWDTVAAGFLLDEDTDYFIVDIPAPAQLWRVQADGENVTRLIVYEMSGTPISTRRKDSGGPLRISDIYLTPGPHVVSVEGKTAYSLRFLQQGPRRDDREFEPNKKGQTIAVGQSIRGQLDIADNDRFLLTLHAPERLTLKLEPPLGETVSLYTYVSGGEVYRKILTGGENTLEFTREFWPGEYVFEVESVAGLTGLDDYQISVMPAQNPFDPIKDREPNDYISMAEAWPSDGVLEGSVGVVRQDDDVYSLNVVKSGSSLRFCALPEDITMEVTGPEDNDLRRKVEKTDDSPCSVFDELQAGIHHVFVTQNNTGAQTGNSSNYRINVTGDAAPAPENVPEIEPLTLTILKKPPAPQAFLENFAQVLSFQIRVQGSLADIPLEWTLRTSEYGWAVEEISADETDPNGTIYSVHIQIPPDVSEREVRLHLRAQSAQGHEGTTSFNLTPDANADAITPHRAYQVPDALLGGLDVASSALGGKVVDLELVDLEDRDPEDINSTRAIINGLAIAGDEFGRRKVDGTPRFSFDLAGDDPVPLAGLLLTPRVEPGGTQTVRDFRVEASIDGNSFEQIYEGELSAAPVEQSIVFNAPIPARFLRLLIDSSWSDYGKSKVIARLGEFKAVAVPEWTPLEDWPANIASESLGGHAAWGEPAGAWTDDIVGSYRDQSISLRNESNASLAIAFNRARTARISAVEWDSAFESKDSPTKNMILSVSLDSPLGPWRKIARWSPPAETTAGEPARFELSTPVWARYLRVDLMAAEGAEHIRLPDRIGVIEAQDLAAPISVLGEWGEFSQSAAYEKLTQPKAPPLLEPQGGETAATAAQLAQNTPITSVVERGAHRDWWTITPPETSPTELRLILDTNRSGGVRAHLYDSTGLEIPLRKATEAEAEERGIDGPLYLARLESNAAHQIMLEEPLRRIIVAWDTSGSTTLYHRALWQALRDISLKADPERDLIGFLPFGGAVLGNELIGDPELLLRRLATNPGDTDSSAAEETLANAAIELGSHDGVRGVILITDAATGRFYDLWKSLKQVHPLIAALALPSTGAFGPNPPRERMLMDTWARVAGGFYQYVSTQADFTEGFNRAVHRMRGPKPYEITVGFAPAEPLPDGELLLTLVKAKTESSSKSASSLLILLDTSGSMLKRLEGKRRYQIAQNALQNLVKQADASGVALGLRRFGIVPESCDTELLSPIINGNSTAILDALKTTVPRNNAKTPIALALTAAARDLGDANGAKRIVVLTDGEETCDGDPAVAIKALIAQGISTRIDIVGFEIDDDALSATFDSWAHLGQGAYYNARGSEELVNALSEMTQVNYRLESYGKTVHSGVIDGEAISLPAGSYQLITDNSSEPLQIEVQSNKQIKIEILR